MRNKYSKLINVIQKLTTTVNQKGDMKHEPVEQPSVTELVTSSEPVNFEKDLKRKNRLKTVYLFHS